MKTILITAGNVSLKAELNDSPTAERIWQELPIQAKVNTWGDEIYFGIPVKAEQEPSAQADVEVGELGYWPPGSAFCIFFGPTPASSGSRPRAASPVNRLGRVLGDATEFRKATDGEKVRIERAT
ncbi:MAG: hypothetical protein A2Z66_06525 [Chloroflexi bacterium RBG_13_66_10]|nr:MAG: hypothetical protein A2Z66_06525 [Chloroflexi bacterium RBG_13_66_10]